MSIKVGDKDLFPYLGDYRPVNIYKGEHKLAGWKWAEQSGEELHFENTYNDFVEVEIDGNSYQGGEPSPDYPIEVHSLNDFDVVSSVGRENLLSKNKFGRYIGGRLEGYDESNYRLVDDVYYVYENPRFSLIGFEFPNPKENITFSGITSYSGVRVYYRGYNKNGSTTVPQRSHYISVHNGEFSSVERLISSHDTDYYILGIGVEGASGNNGWIKPKIETGNQATPYSPAPEDITEDSNHPLIDKINLPLSEPLRSVGDVKDRLFRDSDGLWKIERNVEEITFDGTESWGINKAGSNINTISARLVHSDFVTLSTGADYFDKHITSHFVNRQVYSTENEGTMYNRSKYIYIRVNKDRLTTPDLSGIKDWLGKNPLQVVYIKDTSIETLGQELQDKLNNLRSFQNSNYVYTVISDKTDILPSYISENLKPTIHAQLKVKDI